MTRTALLLGSLLTVGFISAACSEDAGASRRPLQGAKRASTDPTTGAVLPDYNDPHVTSKEGLPDPFEALSQGSAQNTAFCAAAGSMDDSNPNFNAITSAFCKDHAPITSLKDLQNAVGLTFADTSVNGTNGSKNNPAWAFLANSSSLLNRSASSINPRAFLFTPPPGTAVALPGYVVVSFTRGETFAEVAAQSPKAGNKLSFYLVKFDLPCGTTCTNADLLTPATESNWSNVTVYSDEDMKNSLVDCRQCHQPDGPSTPMMLRMQELQAPWTHWFRTNNANDPIGPNPGGAALEEDYFRAHGTDEAYGGIPGVLITKSDGKALEDFVEGQGFKAQPNEFNTTIIETEVEQSSSLQPQINVPIGKSPTWQALFDNAVAGNVIPPPYHDVKVTDPDKLQFATDAYKAFMSGSSKTLDVDVRRVFLDDGLEDMTQLPKLNASGKEVLTQMCTQCHNPKLDQTISRAKFDMTKLDSMSRAEKDLAIKRINLGTADRLHMPPANLRTLPDDAKAAAIAELQK